MIVLMMAVLAIMVCNPVMGQTRKDKKAAKKAEWEVQQQQKAEENALLHQMKMDSIKNAQKAQEAKAKAEQEAAAKAEKERQQQAQYTTYQVPCWHADDEDYYYASASRRRGYNQQNTLATATLRAANQQMQQKIKSAFKQVTRDYFDQMDINEKSDEASHIESAGERIVDTYLNDVLEYCREQTRPDGEGMVIMYIGIKVSKKGLTDALAKGLSNDEKLRLRFDEQKFREDAWKVFKEDQKDSYDDFQKENK
ncbi:MAG: hypothetical protein IJT61_08475 [Bacteroidales bacterium]|nr:hypothetical protein [Bacteroidales bacterium]